MAFTCSLSDRSWSMITPRFLTLVLGFMSIPTTFNESIMTLERCLPVPAIKNSVFSSFLHNMQSILAMIIFLVSFIY